jgi:clan AA aspartic protease (TIGR02281 family)
MLTRAYKALSGAAVVAAVALSANGQVLAETVVLPDGVARPNYSTPTAPKLFAFVDYCARKIDLGDRVMSQRRGPDGECLWFIERDESETLPQAATNSTAWYVPINRRGSVIALDGTINDRVPIRWMLDTGATMSSIPRDVATRLDAKVVGNQRFKLADGTITTKQVILIKKLSIGGAVSVVNIKASVGPAGTAALLGKNFLDAFSSYEINNKQAQLVLRK